MTVDFARLLDESRERDAVITFEVTRGSFEIPARLLAEDLDELGEYELRVLFGKSLPRHDPGDVVNTTRRLNRDGTATITWRRIVTHVREV